MFRFGWYQREILRDYTIKASKFLGLSAALIPMSYGATALMDAMKSPDKVTPSEVFYGTSKVRYFGAPGIEFHRKLEVQGILSNLNLTSTSPKKGDKPLQYQQIISGHIEDSDQSRGYVAIPFQVTMRSFYPIKKISLKNGDTIKIIGTYNHSYFNGFEISNSAP